MYITGNTGSSNVRSITINADAVIAPGDFIHAISFFSPSGPQTVRIGSNAGNDDIMIDTEIGIKHCEALHRDFLNGDLLHISGVVLPLTLKIRK
jgi:hypothetical protein